MDLTSEEKERRSAILRHLKDGEKPVTIYKSIGRSKKWFNKWLRRYKSGRKKWFKNESKRPKKVTNKTDKQVEHIIVDIRKRLMDGNDDSLKYSLVGPEAIQFHMEELEFDRSEIPSLSTIKRIIKRYKLRVNKKKRYKRIRSKGRYTILQPKYIDEMHQIDFVGPRYIKGFGSINSLHLKDVVGRQVAGYQFKGKSMNNVMKFLLDYWKTHPIPKYIQTDNGMSFAGDFIHPRSISRFVKLCLYVGIEVIFIAPAKPWMNGTVEEFNKLFEELFWSKEQFVDLDDIRMKSKVLYETQNKFNRWKLKNKGLKLKQPRRLLNKSCVIDANNLPLVTGRVHFIRVVDSQGKITILNEFFIVGREYIGEYIWATIEVRKSILIISYKDEKLNVREIKRFPYKLPKKVRNRKLSIFRLAN